MRQKLHHILFIVIAALLIMGCTGKDSRSLSDVPETMVCTHADSIALAARHIPQVAQSHKGKEDCSPPAQTHWRRNVRGKGIAPSEQQITAGNQI